MTDVANPALDTPLRLTVVNGDLSYAQFPVIVGHFAGDAISGSEARLDSTLGGILSQRSALGSYPAAVGSVAYVAQPADRRPGGVVVGLGAVSAFSADTIRSALVAGLIELALGEGQFARLRDTIGRLDGGAATAANGAAMVLIGARTGRVSMLDTLAAMLDAIAEAQRRLTAQKLRRFTAIQIFAHMEDTAHSVWHEIDALLAAPPHRGAFVLDTEVAYRDGAARRIVRAGDDPAPTAVLPDTARVAIASPAEAIALIDTIREQIETGLGRSGNRGKLLRALDTLRGRFDDNDWLARPGVAEALGRAFAALNETEAAIALFEAALHHDAAPSLQLVEQLATLRLRAAVAPRADGSFAPDAAQRIGAIRADIEALCRIAGDTVERLTLIGATYKREALLQSGAKVDATLAVMRDCYRRAWQLARERGDANAYYPGQLVVEAGLLIDLRAGHPASAATKADLAQLAADLAQGEEQLDDYWHAASRAGYLLFGELAAGTLSAAAHTAIVHCYDKVMLRCGSNFEFETTLADMRYMRAQLGNGHGAAAAAWIASIEEAIARLES